MSKELNVRNINIYDNTEKLKLEASIVDGEIKRSTSVKWIDSLVEYIIL